MARPARPVALVTGAAHGIGRAVAQSLLAAGWRVGAVDIAERDLTRAFARHGRNATVLDRFGRLDGLVSNAGISRNKPLAKLTLEDWRRVLDVNLTAAFLLARAAEKPLRATKGAIVTIASTRALMSEADTEAYSASKGGLVALTHALSISLGPDVRVNCVSPGWIRTRNYAALRRRDHAQHPAGRVGKPQDIAEIVLYLLDRTRAGFVTGANFVVDGGMTRKMIYVE
jgi:NAD(P)-dependent dehydrogenase (short-subunit alcohol dehydrogenase family)